MPGVPDIVLALRSRADALGLVDMQLLTILTALMFITNFSEEEYSIASPGLIQAVLFLLLKQDGSEGEVDTLIKHIIAALQNTCITAVQRDTLLDMVSRVEKVCSEGSIALIYNDLYSHFQAFDMQDEVDFETLKKIKFCTKQRALMQRILMTSVPCRFSDASLTQKYWLLGAVLLTNMILDIAPEHFVAAIENTNAISLSNASAATTPPKNSKKDSTIKKTIAAAVKITQFIATEPDFTEAMARCYNNADTRFVGDVPLALTEGELRRKLHAYLQPTEYSDLVK